MHACMHARIRQMQVHCSGISAHTSACMPPAIKMPAVKCPRWWCLRCKQWADIVCQPSQMDKDERDYVAATPLRQQPPHPCYASQHGPCMLVRIKILKWVIVQIEDVKSDPSPALVGVMPVNSVFSQTTTKKCITRPAATRKDADTCCGSTD
jgi:hypothetical protein